MASEDKHETKIRMADVASPDSVVIGRTAEDMIMVVMPPSVLAVTFMLTASNHLSVTCEFVNSLAYHIRNEDVKAQRIAPPDLVDLIVENMMQRHGQKSLHEGYFYKGGDGTFDGLYYGEFTSVELAGVAQIMKEIKEIMPPDVRDAPTVGAIVDLWINAGDQFVRDTEYIALMGNEGRA